MTPSPSSPQQTKRTLPTKEAIALLNRLIDDARALPRLAWDSPKRTQWKDTARSALERCGLGDSLLRSFDSAQAISVGSRTTDEQLRKQINAGLESMIAVLHSAVEQLGWTPAVSEDYASKPAHAGFVDTLIIILVSGAIVIFLLWAASRATGLELFEHLPSWLQDSYKAIWSSIAAGTAGFGLAVFKVLTRKENEPRPNYLLLVGITTGCLLVAIFLLLQMFKAQASTKEIKGQDLPFEESVRFSRFDRIGCFGESTSYGRHQPLSARVDCNSPSSSDQYCPNGDFYRAGQTSGFGSEPGLNYG